MESFVVILAILFAIVVSILDMRFKCYWQPEWYLTSKRGTVHPAHRIIKQQNPLNGLDQTLNPTAVHAESVNVLQVATNGPEDKYKTDVEGCLLQNERQMRKIKEVEVELQKKEKRLQDVEAKLRELTLQSKEQMEAKIRDMEAKVRDMEENSRRALNKMNEVSKKELTEEIKRKTTAIKEESNQDLETKIQNLTVKLNNTLRLLNETWATKLKTETENNSIMLKSLQDTFLEKFRDVNYRQDLIHTVIDHMGFMKKETWGTVVLILGALEVVVVIFVCCGFLGAPGQWVKGVNADIVNKGVIQGKSNEAKILPIRIAIDANTISVVCFRNDEVNRLECLGEEIIRDVQTERPTLRIRSCVVNNREDIRDIPACKVALVFVYLDEREMILEDPRQHIGGTPRNDVVEVLMESSVKTILIIYDDPNSTAVILQNKLFNSRLAQIDDHELLRNLCRNQQLLSINNSFSDHQRIHMGNKFREFLS